METKANYAIVGFFTMLVIAAAFGFVYWMAEYGRGGTLAPLAIRIPGSANGLSIGSPVRFNGIAVGSVRSLYIDKEDPQFSVAFTEVRADAPVTASTKAVLEIQGLTGAAYIELSGGNAGDANILEKAIATGEPAVLLADQSSVTNLLATADKILKRADDAIGQLQGFITDARAAAAEESLESYQAVYDDNRHRVYSLAFWMTDNEMAAEALLGDTFRRAFSMTATPGEEMIDRALISELRDCMTIGVLTLKCAVATEVSDIRRNTKRVHLERAIVQIPPTERMVFLMHDGEGYTHARIARTLGLTDEESRGALHQARLRIRELVSQMK